MASEESLNRIIAGMTSAISHLWGEGALGKVFDRMQQEEREFQARVAVRERREEKNHERRKRYASVSHRTNRPLADT